MKSRLLLTCLTTAATAAPDYTLHEWGTFTTLSASDGSFMAGVQREEEPLPEFVESHEGMLHPQWMRAIKGWMRPLEGVTVRMETPVIYFYTKDTFDARVSVGFSGGSISQWYPHRSGGETPPPVKRHPGGWALGKENTLDFSRGYTGGIRWEVKVTPAGEDAAGRVFKPGETPSWIYPRHPDSALVTTKDGQCEKYLFYRGVGRFAPPVTISSGGAGHVTITNTGKEHVGGLLIYEMNESGESRWSTVRGLDAGATAEVNLSQNNATSEWQSGIYAEGIAMLTRAGLYRKEADAMLQTWWPSYFNRPGLRVFWMVPRAFTDAVLPLNVSPAPRETVRVIVGRSEVMTPEFERRLVSDFETEKGRSGWEHDRYFPAFTARVEQLSKRTARQK